jgi:hypothetical protein
MTTPKQTYARQPPQTKEQLRAMLAQAVRNTQPELNNGQAAGKKPKRKSRHQPWVAKIWRRTPSVSQD